MVGFHFFNPVAVMPLIEVVRTPHTTDETTATAMATAAKLRKNAVITKDTPGFVVSLRILAKVLGEAMHAVEHNARLSTSSRSTRPFGLPMTPFELLELVGSQGRRALRHPPQGVPRSLLREREPAQLAELGHIFERDAKVSR